MQNLYPRGLCVALCCLLIPAQFLAQDGHSRTEMYADWDGDKKAWTPTEKIEHSTRPEVGWHKSQTYTWDVNDARWILIQSLERWSDDQGRDTAQVQQTWRQGRNRSWQRVHKQFRYHPRNDSLISEKVVRETRTGGRSGIWNRYYFDAEGELLAESV